MEFSGPKISLEKSWKFTPQVLILIVIGVLVILGVFIFITREKKEALPPEIPSAPTAPPPVQLPPAEEILKPGEIGEIPKTEEPEEPGVSPGAPELPPVVFNTSGKITEVKEDRIIVQGSGSNFADQKPRTLTIIFTASTLTFEPGQKVKYEGLEGLKFLKTGTEILIEGETNIRGKTEIIARTINIL